MKRSVLLIVICLLILSISAEPTIDNLKLENDIIEVNYQKKSAKLAILMSLVVPGAGSIYADYGRWTGYIFPIIDAAMIYGFYKFDAMGHDDERDYEKYVNGETITLVDPATNQDIYVGPRYNRDFQTVVQEYISQVNDNDIYDVYENVDDQNAFYRLDEDNTQHFYEDVGKYDKYVYGWADWYEQYAVEDEHGDVFVDLQWSTTAVDINHTLLGFKHPDETWDAPQSNMRGEYIQMRRDAQDKFDTAEYFLYGMLVNRVAASVDAYYSVKRQNRDYLTQSNFQINYYATMYNENMTPMLSITQRF